MDTDQAVARGQFLCMPCLMQAIVLPEGESIQHRHRALWYVHIRLWRADGARVCGHRSKLAARGMTAVSQDARRADEEHNYNIHCVLVFDTLVGITAQPSGSLWLAQESSCAQPLCPHKQRSRSQSTQLCRGRYQHQSPKLRVFLGRMGAVLIASCREHNGGPKQHCCRGARARGQDAPRNCCLYRACMCARRVAGKSALDGSHRRNPKNIAGICLLASTVHADVALPPRTSYSNRMVGVSSCCEASSERAPWIQA